MYKVVFVDENGHDYYFNYSARQDAEAVKFHCPQCGCECEKMVILNIPDEMVKVFV